MCKPYESRARFGSDTMTLDCNNCGLRKESETLNNRKLFSSRMVLASDSSVESRQASAHSLEVPEHRQKHMFALTNNYISESEGCI